MRTMFVVWLVMQGVLADRMTEDIFTQFPRLFHVDDYERCLASPGGLYCLGSFSLAPLTTGHRLYQAMEEYSTNLLNFNRTLIHRGYCVSSRCQIPNHEGPINQSQRFIDCVEKWTSTLGLKATPLSVDYCKSHRDLEKPLELDGLKIAFLVVVLCIVFCNVTGTIYDVMTSDDEKKNKFALCWSWKGNWRRLTAPAVGDHSDPQRAALQPADGVRVVILLLVMFIHVGLIHFRLFSYNPQYLEKMMRDYIFMMSRNGTPTVCVFVMLSSFLLTHKLLQLGRSRPLTPRLLPACLLHRVARISPSYLLVLLFSASWWAEMGSGPLWAGTGGVAPEADICRRKFWTHALFVNNLVQTHDHCLIQTWFLAVDMQLYLFCCLLTFALVRLGTGKRCLILLTVLFFASCFLNGALAYVFNWRSMLHIMTPENLRSLYYDVPSFSNLYTSAWGSLPASLLGVLLAHVHAHMHDTSFQFTKYKLLTLLYKSSLYLIIALVLSGLWLQRVTSRAALAAFAAADRPLLCLLAALCLLGMFQGVQSHVRRVFSWRVWVVLARLSLAALLLHWSVALSALAGQPQPPPASYTLIIWEWLATATVTYLLSVPLTMLVELPMQRTVDALLT